jgi:hypothetical protein
MAGTERSEPLANTVKFERLTRITERAVDEQATRAHARPADATLLCLSAIEAATDDGKSGCDECAWGTVSGISRADGTADRHC